MAEARSLERVFSECIPVFIALGDATRLKIIQRLYEVREKKERFEIQGLNVKEITEQTSLSRPAVSHHLKILKDAGLIDVQKKGVCNYYYLTNDEAIDRLEELKNIMKRLPRK